MFSFVSGDPSLDLTGTVLSRRDAPVDLLTDPAALERWVGECPGLPDRLTGGGSERDGLFESALALREALYRLALDRVRERPFHPAALETVNVSAAGPPPALRLSDAGARITGDLGAVLAGLARSGIAVLADPGARLKECGRESCTRLYLDQSRGARRAWCGMDGCGNRVKAAAYRARRRRPDAVPPRQKS
ncbi:CGNR zinc finger domain-containing protein [Streptomyces sedi]|uniref:Zinc finger CGNR domain-containing protein n=1 Tax=Streptomyces sedi TaxID=555059 RepID=A0A5C4V586_9ACTN|nr:CGNR zinc finger domain-containing protein [Streptomyces sedi]TNM30765.1 hypothetical protein FH715_11500 [Streptomyces sedi]